MSKPKSTLLRRSTIILPVNRPKFTDSVWKRGADAIMLDLEDSIIPEEKLKAREYVKPAIASALRGGGDVLVRVNNLPELLEGDLEAAVWPGLWGVAIPKLESPEEILAIEKTLSRLESERGIPEGTVKITGLVESASGFLHAEEILSAGTRIRSMIMGTEDLVKDLGMQLVDGDMIYYPKLQYLFVGKALGLHCNGIIGTHSGYDDLEGLYRSARKAFLHGYNGSSCIHPSQIPVLNRAFSPLPEDVTYARRVVEAFEISVQQKLGACALDNRMIDIPIVEGARNVIALADAIDTLEARKQEYISRTKAELGISD